MEEVRLGLLGLVEVWLHWESLVRRHSWLHHKLGWLACLIVNSISILLYRLAIGKAVAIERQPGYAYAIPLEHGTLGYPC
jgi:hypothetical protein